jgi:hypothetical protein
LARASLGSIENEIQNFCLARVDRIGIRAAFHVGCERRLVGEIDSGDIKKVAGSGTPVEAFRVPRFTHIERGADVDFDKTGDALADFIADAPEWRTSRNHHRETLLSQRSGASADPANVLVAILPGVSEIAIRPTPDLIAIEPFHTESELP